MDDLLVLFITVILAIYCIARCTLIVVTVQGSSMFPTLENGERVLVWKYWPARWLQRGQIVVISGFNLHEGIKETAANSLYIKRVVALPNDTLTSHISDLSEPYQNDFYLKSEHDIDGMRVWHIPAKHIFVRGDCASKSVDSLVWGAISFRNFKGIVIKKLSEERESTHL